MSAVPAIVRNESRLMLKDSFVLTLLVLMPLVLLAFLSHGIVGGPARSVPGLATLFGFLGLSMVAQAFFRDHGWNTWDHFRSSPARAIEVIVGKALPLAALFMIQLTVLLTIGWLVFDMPWEGSVAGGVLVVLGVVATEVSLGLLLATLCRSIYQTNALANVGGLFLAGLGGALAPISTLPAWAQHLAPISPVYWALRGFRDVITHTGGIDRVMEPFLVMLLYSAVALAIVVWRYRFDAPKTFYA